MAASLSGLVAVVTGAGSGIGRAVAQSLAAEGATVCLVGRTREKLEATAGALPAGVPPRRSCPWILAADEQIEGLERELAGRFGRVDVLVLCADELAQGNIADTPVAVLDRLYRNNVRATYLLVQRLLPMVKKRPGQIVFMNSSAGQGARPGAGAFAATKQALKAIADALRGEVNADGVRVLSVFPGRTATPRIEALSAKEARDYRPELLLQPEDVASAVTNALSLPRTAEVTEINIRSLAKSY